VIHSVQTRIGTNGVAAAALAMDLVKYGCSPAEAAAVLKQRETHDRRETADLDSEAGRANAAHVRRWGLSEEDAREYLAQSLRLDFLEDGAKRAGEIAALWKDYEGSPSAENKAKVLEQMKLVGGNSMGIISPELERALRAVAGSPDADLRIGALTGLTQHVPAAYAGELEKALVAAKRHFDLPTLRALEGARWGSPRAVLSDKAADLSSVELRQLAYAPEDRAVAELLARFAKGSKHEKPEIVELLSCFCHPDACGLIGRLAADLSENDLAFGKTDMSYALRPLIVGAARLDLPGAPGLFHKWFDWRDRRKEDGDPKGRVFGMAFDMTLLTAAAELRDPAVLDRLIKSLDARPADLIMFMNPEQVEKLAGVNLRLTPRKMAAMLDAPMPHPWGEKPLEGEQIFFLFRLLRCSPSQENLEFMMSRLMPGWSAQKDYSEWEALSKDWYARRKGLTPPKIPGESLKLLQEVLPCFGPAGADVLLQLHQAPGLRRCTIPALREVRATKEQAWRIRAALDGISPRSEDEAFELGLTAWCYGDQKQRDKYFKYLLYPRNYAKANTVRQAVGRLPFGELVALLEDVERRNPDNCFPGWASAALVNHVNRRSAELMLALWEKDANASFNPVYGQLFNKMAGRNFGMDKARIRAWAGTLPEKE
jgi:hypothetical protein